MKKLFSILAILLLATTASAQGLPALPEAEPVVIGSLTAMSGMFMGPYWGINTTDMDVRRLLHQYNTVVRQPDGHLVVNDVAVRSLDTALDAQGNRVFTVTLHDDLFFSDGAPVTAKDYLFTLLLEASPLMTNLGATVKDYGYLAGGAAYQAGDESLLAGARLLGERTFSIAVLPGALPYYFELGYISLQPYALHDILPEAQVMDDGMGAYLSGLPDAQALFDRLLLPGTGYASHPAVVTGPYVLDSYDADNAVATFSINPFFKGNENGIKPSIPRIEVRRVMADEVINDLNSGAVDIVNKVVSAAMIDGAIAQGMQSSRYPRTGLAFVAFAAESGPSSDLFVRQAVAHSIDKQALVDEFIGRYGVAVDGYYGVGQWMYAEMLKGQNGFAHYDPDAQGAQRMLESAGYTLNESGAAFTPGTDLIRYRMADGAPQPLTLHFMITDNNPPAEIIVRQLEQNLVPLGVELLVERVSMQNLLRRYYRQDERGFDLTFLGSNFDTIFDPFFTFNEGERYQGALNSTAARDPDLMARAMDMRRTQPNDHQMYFTRWLAFQDRFTRVLPLIPLYSNDYFDLFRQGIENYRPDAFSSFAEAIVEARLTNP